LDRRRPVAALLLAALVASFVARTAGLYPAELVLDVDTDEVLALADRAGAGHGWLAPGHGVTPTRIRLGPLWHDEVALATWLGGDLERAWRLLVGLDLVGILAATAVLWRVLGPLGAVGFAAVLLSDPLYVAEQAWPFWYQQHLVSWAAPAAAAWVALAATSGLGALLAGAVLTGLAVQLHAMAWTLIPVGVVATAVARRRLSAGDVVVGTLAFAVAAWPMVRQVPALAHPDAWTTMVSLQADPAVHGDRLGALARLITGLPGRVTAGLVAVPVALGAALAGVRGTASQWGLAAVVLAWLVAGAVVFGLVAHRWHVHYELVLLIPLALAVGGAVATLEVRRSWAAPVAVLAIAARPLLPFDWGFVPVAPIPWELASVQEEAAARLVDPCRSSSAPAILPTVHGLPCAWPGVCAAELLRRRVDPPDEGGIQEAIDCSQAFRDCPGEGPERDRGFRMEGTTPRLWCRDVSAPGALDGPWAAVVLLGGGDVDMAGSAGWHVATAELPGDRVVRLLTAEVGADGAPPLPTLPPGVRRVDAFSTDERWTLEDLGLVPLAR
jgi:hypothetical protein